MEPGCHMQKAVPSGNSSSSIPNLTCFFLPVVSFQLCTVAALLIWCSCSTALFLQPGLSDTPAFALPAIFFYKKFFDEKLKNVSCEYNRLNGWNSTLQAAWYIRHVRIIWFLWTRPTIWLLILSFTQNIVRACSMFFISCEYSRLNGWNSTLQAAWYIRRVRIIWFLWTRPTIWLLILSCTQNVVQLNRADLIGE